MTAVETEAPVYLRLRGLLAASILGGEYREGEQLPSVRTFAAEQGANPLTVAKAYQALQDEGYVSFLHHAWPRIRAHIDRLGIDARDLVSGAEIA
jgi:GntR family transcriptional regulator